MFFVIGSLSRTILIGPFAFALSQCFGPSREETHTRIFQEPTPKIFAGRYHLVYQHMDRALPEHKSFPQSFLTLRADGTYTADNYPIFARVPQNAFTFQFQRVAHFEGNWHISKSSQKAWSFDLDPIPGGSRRGNGSEALFVDAIISKTSGQVGFIHFYTGDIDAGQVLSYERSSGNDN
jgi:hypothetical protein